MNKLLSPYMFVYDKTFDPKVVLGHCDHILPFDDFPLYLGTPLVYKHTSFTIYVAYDKTFDCKVFLCHCDLISWFSDVALYLYTQLVFFHTSFRLLMSMTRPLNQT